jgi:hypothetical protein
MKVSLLLALEPTLDWQRKLDLNFVDKKEISQPDFFMKVS